MPERNVPTLPGMGPAGPPARVPVRVAAMRRLYPLFGMQETEGVNWGPLIRKWGAYFIPEKRLATFAPGGKRAGLLAWCGITACAVVYEELLDRGHAELAAQWKRISSAQVSVIWNNLTALGYTWRRGEPLPQALSPQAVDVPGLPAPGDFVFYGHVLEDGSLSFTHIDFYEAPGPEGDEFDSVGGNTGTPPNINRIDRVHRRGPDAAEHVLGYARFLW